MKIPWIAYSACLVVAMQALTASSADYSVDSSRISSKLLFSSNATSPDVIHSDNSAYMLLEGDGNLYLYQDTVDRKIELVCNKSDNGSYPIYAGFIVAGVAVIFYGSNFVPIKRFDTGDGKEFVFVLF
jgi:hypothetical protein